MQKTEALCRYDSRRKVKKTRKKLLKIGLGKIAKFLNIKYLKKWIKLSQKAAK